jgi:hypothetical protein
MKKQETHIVKEKTQVKPLPGNVKVVIGKSITDKLEHAKAISASIKGFKK